MPDLNFGYLSHDEKPPRYVDSLAPLRLEVSDMNAVRLFEATLRAREDNSIEVEIAHMHEQLLFHMSEQPAPADERRKSQGWKYATSCNKSSCFVMCLPGHWRKLLIQNGRRPLGHP